MAKPHDFKSLQKKRIKTSAESIESVNTRTHFQHIFGRQVKIPQPNGHSSSRLQSAPLPVWDSASCAWSLPAFRETGVRSIGEGETWGDWRVWRKEWWTNKHIHKCVVWDFLGALLTIKKLTGIRVDITIKHYKGRLSGDDEPYLSIRFAENSYKLQKSSVESPLIAGWTWYTIPNWRVFLHTAWRSEEL